VLFLRGGGDRHVIYIGITEIQVSENLIDEPLKCLRGVSEPEGHIWEFEKAKRRDDGSFCDVVRMNWNLMVWFHQIYRGEDFPANKLLRIVGNVPNGILVGDRSSIQSTIVATGSPAVFFLGTRWRGKAQGLSDRQRCHFVAFPRTRVSRFVSGPVLAAVGAKLQVVQA